MKREEKNQQTQRRIMDTPLAEFAEKGHGGSSVNTICAAQGISKGIIYHYFENKDELYLACVEECFQRLTAHLSAALPEEDDGSVEDQLGRYFTARMTFFQENPVYQPIFCEAVISPPARLFEQIQARRKAFDALTISAAYGHYHGGSGGPIPAVSGLYQCAGASIFHACEEVLCSSGCPVPPAVDCPALRRHRKGG